MAATQRSRLDSLPYEPAYERGRSKNWDPNRATFNGFLKAVKMARGRDRDQAVEGNRIIEKVYGSGWSRTEPTVAKTAMGVNSGTTGGYLLPTGFTYELLRTVSEKSFIYPRATVLPMDSGNNLAPRIDVETVQSAGISPLFGGVQFKWGSENTPAETEPKFRQTELHAWDLIGYAVVANQVLDDTGPKGEEYLINLFGRAGAWAAEYAFLQGGGTANPTGPGMPLGILKAPASILTGNNGGKTGRQTGGTITVGDLVVMTSKLLPSSWETAIWACHPSALNPIQQLSQYFINVELGHLSKTARQAAGVLMTLPLFVTDKLPALGTAGDLVLFDPYLYVIGERQEVLIDVSDHTLFQTQQTVFRVWLRLDGKPMLSNSVTIADGSTVVSPYVVLN